MDLFTSFVAADLLEAGFVIVEFNDGLVLLDELTDWDDAILISLDPLIEMICLQLRENLDDSSLHSGLGHQWLVVRGGETLLSDLNSLNWFHSISDLVVLAGHELASRHHHALVQKFADVLKDEDVSLLPKLNLVKNLNAREP